MPASELTITRMQESGLAVLDSLRETENWNQTPEDLKRFLDYEPEGCFLARWKGRAVGTVTTTAYGSDLGWIGMMLVHPDYRQRGIASALIQTSLDYLNRRGVACIKLDATPAGKPVYERLGFHAEWEFERWERSGVSRVQVPIPSQTEFEPPDNDEAIFGANRSAWLKRLASGSRVISRDLAYGMLRPGARAAYLGPVIADDSAAAEAIIEELVGSCECTIYWDVPGSNENAVNIAEACGFRPVRQLLRMWTGSKRLPGDVTRQYAIADPATG